MGFYLYICLGIDIKYLANSATTDLGQVDDIGRKALLLRRMIQRTQNSLRSVDKVLIISHLYEYEYLIYSVKNQ